MSCRGSGAREGSEKELSSVQFTFRLVWRKFESVKSSNTGKTTSYYNLYLFVYHFKIPWENPQTLKCLLSWATRCFFFFFFVLFHVGVHSFIHDAMFRVAQHLRRYIIRLSVIRLSQNLEEKKERKKNTFTFFQAARSFFSFSFLFCVCVAPARDTCTRSGKQLRLMHSARVKAVLPNASYRNTFYESRYVWGYLGLLTMRQQNISDI